MSSDDAAVEPALDASDEPEMDEGVEGDASAAKDMAVADTSVTDLDRGFEEEDDLAFGELDFGSPDEEDGGGLGGVFDLSGTYSVVSDVLIATGGGLEEGDSEHVLVRLTRLDGFRYRIEVFEARESERLYVVPSVDFAAPEGIGHYQFEYTRREVGAGNQQCDEVETRFQRGTMRPTRGNRFEFEARETRTFEYAGDRCAAGGYDVLMDVHWFPVPT
jgi:hypothetical protein